MTAQERDNESVKGTGRSSILEESKKPTDSTNLNYMNYETFKKAIVRLSIIGCEYLGG